MNKYRLTSEMEEQACGQDAAQRLCDDWPDSTWLPEQPKQQWAQGALQEFAKIIRSQRKIFQASQLGAEIGAKMLSPRLFQGLSESLQNADDLGASELRIVLRSRSYRELLLIHNGDPVSLAHVGAMVLPWLSTKADDDGASGRFGIGQKTLKALGGPLEMHCTPFSFVMRDDTPEWVKPALPVIDFYRPDERDTMLIVPLNDEIQDSELLKAVDSLGVASLIFLRHIRKLSFVNLDASGDNRTFSIDATPVRESKLNFGTELRIVRHDTLQIANPIDSAGIQFERYWTDSPVETHSKRLHKATGKYTPLGICICSDLDRAGAFYDRIPLPIKIEGPISLNAQFDPDGARSTILENEWNMERLADLGQFLGVVALNTFGRATSSAWMHVPLSTESVEAGDWLKNQYAEAVTGECHARLIADLRLPTANGPAPLSEIVYDRENIEALVTSSDMELLATGHSAILSNCLDDLGRWRKVLDDLNQSRSLGPADALQLFDNFGHIDGREPDWFVKMAALAIENGIWTEFSEKYALLLADGRHIACPAKNSSRVLVQIDNPNSLANRLGLALPLHRAYMAENPPAKTVVAKLSEIKALQESCNQPTEVLQLLSRSGESTEQPVRIEDDDLLGLRAAWAQLTRDQQKDMSNKIGANVELRTIMYQGSSKKPVRIWARPCEAYLPTAIDRRKDSFAKAAGRTPGLNWIDPKYADLLKQQRGSTEAGAQRFLVALGVSSDPRLIVPSNELVKWSRDPRPASPVSEIDRPDAQLRAIKSGGSGNYYLLDDRWSLDLDSVVENIQSGPDPATKKRKRALALLAVLNRGWKRRYADFQTANAVVGSYGFWVNSREVQATWLARLASTAWLPNGHGALKAPNELALPTGANRLIYGVNRSAYLAKANQSPLQYDFLQALGIRLGPSSDDLISKLRHSCDKPVTSEVTDQVNTIYHLLAADLQKSATDLFAGRVITPQRLRNAFRASPGRNGLLLANGQWHLPESVLRGPPIFGRHRVFAPHITGLEQLWEALRIPEPSAKDCVRVLRKLARNPSLDSFDVGVVLMTFRVLATLVNGASPQLRIALRGLPLWTGKAWSTARPMYVLDGEAIAGTDIPGLDVWQPGFTSFHDLQSLFPVLDLVHLRLEDFAPQSLSSAGVSEGKKKRKNFAEAVALFSDELIRNDIGLHESITCDWSELSQAQFIIDPALEISLHLEGRPNIRFPARAHMMREPLTFIVRNLQDAEASEAGGQAIASLFTGDRQKLAWAWTSVWRRASSGKEASNIILPSTKTKTLSTVARLTDLQNQASGRRETVKIVQAGSGKPSTKLQPTVQVRQLRDIEGLEPSEGTIVNDGVSNKGVVFPKSRMKGRAGRSFNLASNDKTNPAWSFTRTVLPPVSDREKLALETVKRALQLDSKQIQDVRKKRAIGVDAIDELRQCYEIKMSSGATFPTDVSLTPSEVDAAQNDPNFFLAVVAGLEAGDGNLRVRFIFKPLEQLSTKISGNVTLTGVDQAEALEYEFSALDIHRDP